MHSYHSRQSTHSSNPGSLPDNQWSDEAPQHPAGEGPRAVVNASFSDSQSFEGTLPSLPAIPSYLEADGETPVQADIGPGIDD